MFKVNVQSCDDSKASLKPGCDVTHCMLPSYAGVISVNKHDNTSAYLCRLYILLYLCCTHVHDLMNCPSFLCTQYLLIAPLCCGAGLGQEKDIESVNLVVLMIMVPSPCIGGVIYTT